MSRNETTEGELQIQNKCFDVRARKAEDALPETLLSRRKRARRKLKAQRSQSLTKRS